ncbi:MAG: dihydropteroate synthase [Coriobacteriales bacterium]|jgi:5-methyltetrahydrofolate--homocysteine methyltransferase|nr:dihydropteroate synthase [Coriobacteriales bacterium]
MIIIGELINGTRAAVKEAILSRNRQFIVDLVERQAIAGASYIDVNAGTSPDREAEDMLWLIDIVQAVSEKPVSIDSSSPETLQAALAHVAQLPMVNSINADPRRLQSFLPLIADIGCPVVALSLDESQSGMPKDNAERFQNIAAIFQATRTAGIADERLYVDPLVMSVSTDTSAGLEALACIRSIREIYPEAHITGGLSNISFGLPKRELVNRTFLTIAMTAGMDSAICDPANTALIESLKATEMILGRDRFCRKYTIAAKNGFASI